jgi:uncharacterized protein YecT (DUF1311 family)
MKTVAALGLLFALAGGPLHAVEEGEVHPIDRFYDHCIDKNGSTAGMVECTEKAYGKWDAEMNRVYGALLKALPPKKAAVLEQSQRDWLTYRDSNQKLIDAVYAGLQGTMYVPMHAYARLRLVRERTLLLTGYLELAKESADP